MRLREFVNLFMLLCLALALAGAGPAPEPQPEPEPRFQAAEQTIKDTETGYVWLRDADPAGGPLSWNQAIEYVALLNKRNHAGHSDWKLPGIDVMIKFITAVRAEPTGASGDRTTASAMEQMGIRNMKAGDYWSGTTSVYNSAEAWYLSTVKVNKSVGSKSLYMHVWPVRYAP